MLIQLFSALLYSVFQDLIQTDVLVEFTKYMWVAFIVPAVGTNVYPNVKNKK